MIPSIEWVVVWVQKQLPGQVGAGCNPARGLGDPAPGRRAIPHEIEAPIGRWAELSFEPRSMPGAVRVRG